MAIYLPSLHLRAALKAARSERQVAELQRRLATLETSSSELEAALQAEKEKGSREIGDLDRQLQEMEAVHKSAVAQAVADAKQRLEHAQQQHASALEVLRSQHARDKVGNVHEPLILHENVACLSCRAEHRVIGSLEKKLLTLLFLIFYFADSGCGG